MRTLRSDEQRFLAAVKRFHENGFDGMTTGRRHRAATARRLQAAGLVEMQHMHPSDGDGHVNENRAMRPAYSLTDAGREALAQEPEVPHG